MFIQRCSRPTRHRFDAPAVHGGLVKAAVTLLHHCDVALYNEAGGNLDLVGNCRHWIDLPRYKIIEIKGVPRIAPCLLPEGDTGIYVGQCLDADGRNKGHVQDAKRHPNRKSSQAANATKNSRTIPHIRISATSWVPATGRQMVQAFLLTVDALICGAFRACRGQLRYNDVLDEFLPEIDSSIVGLNGNACSGSGLVDDSGLYPPTSLYAAPPSSSSAATLAQPASGRTLSHVIAGSSSSSGYTPAPPSTSAPAIPHPQIIVGSNLDPTTAPTQAEAECRSLVRRMLRGGIYSPIGITPLPEGNSREWREVQLRFPHRFAGGAKPLMIPMDNQKELGIDKMSAGKVMARVQLLPRPSGAPVALMTTSFNMCFFAAYDLQLTIGERSTSLSWHNLRTSSDSLAFLLWLHEYAGGVPLEDVDAPSVLEADLVALSRVGKPAGWLDARWEETIGASTFGNRRATVFDGPRRAIHTWDGKQQNTLRFPGPPNDSAARSWELIYAVNAAAGKAWYAYKLAGDMSPITDWIELEGTMAQELINIVNDCRFLRGLAPLNALPLLHIEPLPLQYPALFFSVKIGENSNGQHRSVNVIGEDVLCPKPLVRSAGQDVASYIKIDPDVPVKKVMWWNPTTRRGSS